MAIYIALPFFLRKKEIVDQTFSYKEGDGADPTQESLVSLNNQKENLYAAIKDIEFDYGLGKLSKEDFDELNSKYKSEAASILKHIDGIEKEGGVKNLDDELEQEILSQRKSSRTLDVDIESEISAFRASSSNKPNCASCGAEYESEDLFCSKCGAKLKE